MKKLMIVLLGFVLMSSCNHRPPRSKDPNVYRSGNSTVIDRRLSEQPIGRTTLRSVRDSRTDNIKGFGPFCIGDDFSSIANILEKEEIQYSLMTYDTLTDLINQDTSLFMNDNGDVLRYGHPEFAEISLWRYQINDLIFFDVDLSFFEGKLYKIRMNPPEKYMKLFIDKYGNANVKIVDYTHDDFEIKDMLWKNDKVNCSYHTEQLSDEFFERNQQGIPSTKIIELSTNSTVNEFVMVSMEAGIVDRINMHMVHADWVRRQYLLKRDVDTYNKI